MKLFEDLRDGEINLKQVLRNQSRFKSNLSEIKMWRKKSINQKNTIKNITNFFDLRKKTIDFFRDYSFLLSEAKCKAKYGKELKILTPKQMLQRLPAALAQVNAGNNSESLLNEILQIVYLLY